MVYHNPVFPSKFSIDYFTNPWYNLTQGRNTWNRHGSGKPGWCIKLAEYARGNRADRAVDVIFCLGSFKPTAKLDEFSNGFLRIDSAVSHSSIEQVCPRLIIVSMKCNVDGSGVCSGCVRSYSPIGWHNRKRFECFNSTHSSTPSSTIIGIDEQFFPCVGSFFTHIVHTNRDRGLACCFEEIWWCRLTIASMRFVSTKHR